MKLILSFFIIFFHTFYSQAQSTTDSLYAQIKLGSRFRPQMYFLTNYDIKHLNRLQMLLKKVEELSIFYDDFVDKKIELSEDGERYFEELFANVYFELFTKSMHTSMNNYIFKYPFTLPKYNNSSTTSAIPIPNSKQFNLMRIIAKNSLESESMENCELISSSLRDNPARVRFLRHVYMDFKDDILLSKKNSDDKCVIANLNYLLSIIEAD